MEDDFFKKYMPYKLDVAREILFFHMNMSLLVSHVDIT